METTAYFCSKSKRMKKIAFGLLLIIAGVLLMCINAGTIPIEYKHIIFSWPMILVAIGFINFFSKESMFTGLILFLVGGFFMIPRIMDMPDNFTQNFWPGLLIIAGILFIAKRTFFRSHVHSHFKKMHTTSELKNETGYIEMNNIFGGGKHKIAPTEFKGGKINNVFGGAEIDLSQTTLAPGTNVLEIECIFGGVSLIVPSEWNVQLQMSSSVMGGFSDKRTIVKPSQPSDSELIIKGTAIFGGGEIKSY